MNKNKLEEEVREKNLRNWGVGGMKTEHRMTGKAKLDAE
jgi:hypothetical protein